MATFPLAIADQFPWLRFFDQRDADNRLGVDNYITLEDIHAWLSEEPLLQAAQSLPPEAKEDLFVIAQTSAELRFKLVLLSEEHFSKNAVRFATEGKKLIGRFRHRLESYPSTNFYENIVLEKEMEELDQLENEFLEEAGRFPSEAGGLGISYERISDSLFEGQGIYIHLVHPDSPAYGNLAPGDVIIQMGGMIHGENHTQKLSISELAMPTVSLQELAEKGARLKAPTPDEMIQETLHGQPHSAITLTVRRFQDERTRQWQQFDLTLFRTFNRFPQMFHPLERVTDGWFPIDPYGEIANRALGSAASLWNSRP